MSFNEIIIGGGVGGVIVVGGDGGEGNSGGSVGCGGSSVGGGIGVVVGAVIIIVVICGGGGGSGGCSVGGDDDSGGDDDIFIRISNDINVKSLIQKLSKLYMQKFCQVTKFLQKLVMCNYKMPRVIDIVINHVHFMYSHFLFMLQKQILLAWLVQ